MVPHQEVLYYLMLAGLAAIENADRRRWYKSPLSERGASETVSAGRLSHLLSRFKSGDQWRIG